MLAFAGEFEGRSLDGPVIRLSAAGSEIKLVRGTIQYIRQSGTRVSDEMSRFVSFFIQ